MECNNTFTDEMAKFVVDFLPISDRTMLLILEITYRRLNIVQIYAPTAWGKLKNFTNAEIRLNYAMSELCLNKFLRAN